MNLPTWSVQNRVAVNLLAIVLLVAGLLSATTRLKVDLFPDVSTNLIAVRVADLGSSSAEEMERTVTVPLEEELARVKAATKIQSLTEENFATVFLEIDPALPSTEPALNEVRQAVDKARPKLPATAEPPVIETFDVPIPLITFTISYPPGTSEHEIRPLLERLERRLRITPGVSDVLIDGYDRREVWIEADPALMQLFGISFPRLAEALRAQNLSATAGRFNSSSGRRTVRLSGEIQSAPELSALAIPSPKGNPIPLQEFARFVDRSEEDLTIGRANLRPAVTLTVVKQRGADALLAVAQARRVFTEETRTLPPEIQTQILSDTTRFIRVRINTVVQNGIQALILVSVLLLLFLDWRIALIVAVGIPISFAGTFLVLYLGGYTINLLSLFGMIMALGMVVDDAIVMSENACRYMQEGLPPAQAAIRGASEVLWPVFGSVSTTVAAFLPLMWGEGIIGKFLVIVPVVVISTLTFSLIQAFIVLPSHIADFAKAPPTSAAIAALPPPRSLPARALRLIALTYAEMREATDSALRIVIKHYLSVLTLALRFRYLCITAFAAMFLGLIMVAALGAVPFKLFSADFADLLFIKLELPRDASLRQTAEAVRRVETRLIEALPPDDILGLVSRIGSRLDPSDQFQEFGNNLAQIIVDLDEENPAARKPSAVARHIRTLLREFPEFVSATAEPRRNGPPVGRPVNIELVGADFNDLRQAAAEVQARLKNMPGLTNIGTDLPPGKTELAITINDARAAELGLTEQDIATHLQALFRGLEARRLRWGNEEVSLRVKAPEHLRHDPEFLRSQRILNPAGIPIPIEEVATITTQSSIPRIKRVNLERLITVSADIDERATTSVAANAEISRWLPEILARHPGVYHRLTGENEDTARSLAAMKFAAIVALLLIYALLAIITNSFMQPLVIMSVIPFGIIGVLLGLTIMGQPLGLMAIMGTVALAGIVVNNSVVFVDFINRARHRATHDATASPRHQPWHIPRFTRWSSILHAASVRFRPVFLTTATTVAGLSNLAFTTRGQEQFLAPMAQAIIFGLTFATLLTLLLIPCLYSVLDDLRSAFRRHTSPAPTPHPTAATHSASI